MAGDAGLQNAGIEDLAARKPAAIHDSFEARASVPGNMQKRGRGIAVHSTQTSHSLPCRGHIGRPPGTRAATPCHTASADRPRQVEVNLERNFSLFFNSFIVYKNNILCVQPAFTPPRPTTKLRENWKGFPFLAVVCLAATPLSRVPRLRRLPRTDN